MPKKVNRHVYKAVNELQDTLSGFVSAELINQHVKYNLRHGKPLNNVDEFIHQSLCNLTNLGVLACTGSSGYAIRHTIKRASKKFTGVPGCDLGSKASKRSAAAKNPSVRNIKRGLKSRTKRIHVPIKRTKRGYGRGKSIICLGCRSGLVDICKMLTQNNLVEMNVKLESSESNRQLFAESSNMEMDVVLESDTSSESTIYNESN